MSKLGQGPTKPSLSMVCFSPAALGSSDAGNNACVYTMSRPHAALYYPLQRSKALDFSSDAGHAVSARHDSSVAVTALGPDRGTMTKPTTIAAVFDKTLMGFTHTYPPKQREEARFAVVPSYEVSINR